MTGFWVFMLIMCLLTPAMMIGFGKYFMKGGPKQINWGVWISDEKIHEKIRRPGRLRISIVGKFGSTVD